MDECADSLDSCQQNCTNTVGSVVCSCNEGFELNADGFSCNGMYVYYNYTHYHCVIVLKWFIFALIMAPEDVAFNREVCFTLPFIFAVAVIPGNECPMNNNCSQVCVLLNGTESCSCLAGFELLTDETTCQGWIGQCTQPPINVVYACRVIGALF